MLGTAGYYWGPLIFEWAVFRAVLGAALVKRLLAGPRPQIELARRPARMAAAAGLFLFLVDLRWFLPLLAEMNRFGEVQQIRGYYGSIGMILRPLWLEPALRTLELPLPGSLGALSSTLAEWRLLPLDWPETIVSVGWIYLVPAALGLWLSCRGRGGPGPGPLLAFFATWVFGVLYAREGWPSSYHDAVARVVPFMNYFRVASRMGLVFVPLLGAMIALAWPELSLWVRERWSASRSFRVVAVTFAALSAAEVSTLATPIVTMPPLTPQMSTLLDRLRGEPGSTVLDMPFCVAGGNGACTPEFCARYPGQTMPMYLTARHGKKVFGVYQGRMNEQQCAKYREPPYGQWAEAWRGDRCLTPAEWDGLCAYLAGSHDISAILVFPGIWTAAGQPECASEFRRRLGAPRARAEIATNFSRSPIADSDRAESIASYGPTPVLWYGARCSEPGRIRRPPAN
jgi:hypothetical protein